MVYSIVPPNTAGCQFPLRKDTSVMKREYLMMRVREAVRDSGHADMLIAWIDQYVEEQRMLSRVSERVACLGEQLEEMNGRIRTLEG